MSNTKAYNIDCMELLKQTPDNYYSLALVDPPYGININNNIGRRKGDKRSEYKETYWDDDIPNSDYFSELLRVSCNQIIWGGNYFPNLWEYGCKGYIIWDKGYSEKVSFSMSEFAWTSFDIVPKTFYYNAAKNNNNKRIHPTQKPVALYEWLLMNYAKKGDKILDTHLGSGSSRIAAHKLGFEFVGCEIDKDYFEAQEKRFKDETMQQQLF